MFFSVAVVTLKHIAICTALYTVQIAQGLYFDPHTVNCKHPSQFRDPLLVRSQFSYVTKDYY